MKERVFQPGMNRNPLFVYGSLRMGKGNHRVLGYYFTYAGKTELHGNYRLISLGYFPGLVPADTPSRVIGELYWVDDETLDRVDLLEGHPRHYRREMVMVVAGCAAWTYIYQGPTIGRPIVSGGDWLGREDEPCISSK